MVSTPRTPAKPKKQKPKSKWSWLRRHTITVTNRGCWHWRGDNPTDMTDRELCYHMLTEELPSGVTVEPRSTCTKNCINPDHMTKVYNDLEERQAGSPQSAKTVRRILEHEGDYHEIAALFKASWQTVFNIKNGRSHRDITGLPWIDVRKSVLTQTLQPPASED